MHTHKHTHIRTHTFTHTPSIRAVKIESKMDAEPTHAATYISLSTTYSLLGRHEEALDSAKRAVDILCKDPGWQNAASDQDSEAGAMMPVAFNNLAVEFEHLGDKEMAQQSYGYAVKLATMRWGAKDARTADIRMHLQEAQEGKQLTHFDAETARTFFGPKKRAPKDRNSSQPGR
jgi:hypothetical protein